MTVLIGNRGDLVRNIQRALAEHGFSPGAADGIFGRATEDAVEAFQRAQHLGVDGKVGNNTARALGVDLNSDTFTPPVTPGGTVTRPTSNNTRVTVQMPDSGPGFRSYYPASKRFGTQRTIDSLKLAAQRYHERTGKTLLIGDISVRNGGAISGHASHRKGVDVDLRPASSGDGPTTWQSAGYNRDQTREMIKALRATGNVQTIFFNDPVLIREGLTQKWPNHDNHLHVRYH